MKIQHIFDYQTDCQVISSVLTQSQQEAGWLRGNVWFAGDVLQLGRDDDRRFQNLKTRNTLMRERIGHDFTDAIFKCFDCE